MSLQVVEAKCQFTPDRTRGVVVVRSDCEGPPFHDAFHELDSTAARSVAQAYAGQAGMGAAYINGNVVGPYPVNAEGISLEDVRGEQGEPLPPTHQRMQPKWYQIDVPVARPLR